MCQVDFRWHLQSRTMARFNPRGTQDLILKYLVFRSKTSQSFKSKNSSRPVVKWAFRLRGRQSSRVRICTRSDLLRRHFELKNSPEVRMERGLHPSTSLAFPCHTSTSLKKIRSALPSVVREAHCTIHGIYSFAERDRYVEGGAPAAGTGRAEVPDAVQKQPETKVIPTLFHTERRLRRH